MAATSLSLIILLSIAVLCKDGKLGRCFIMQTHVFSCQAVRGGRTEWEKRLNGHILRLFTPDDGIYIASTHAGGAYKSYFLYINNNPVVWHGDLDS